MSWQARGRTATTLAAVAVCFCIIFGAEVMSQTMRGPPNTTHTTTMMALHSVGEEKEMEKPSIESTRPGVLAHDTEKKKKGNSMFVGECIRPGVSEEELEKKIILTVDTEIQGPGVCEEDTENKKKQNSTFGSECIRPSVSKEDTEKKRKKWNSTPVTESLSQGSNNEAEKKRKKRNSTTLGREATPRPGVSEAELEKKNQNNSTEETLEGEDLYPLEYPILLAPVSFIDLGGFSTIATSALGRVPEASGEERITIIAPCFGLCMRQTYDGRCVSDTQCLSITNSI